MLHETQDFSLTAEMAVLVPTGNQPLAGKTALIPAFAFWNNFAGRWVIRGGIGDYIPLGGGGTDNLISQLAIGQTLTDHDVPLFGDFTWYVSTVVNTPLSNGQHTSVTLTPGMRTHLGRDWYFLAGLPTPVTSRANRRHRHDLLVHEGVVSRGGDPAQAAEPGGPFPSPGLRRDADMSRTTPLSPGVIPSPALPGHLVGSLSDPGFATYRWLPLTDYRT